MKLFKKIRFTVQSGIETLLDNVENHEASAAALVKESRDSIARAEMKAERLKREGETLLKRIEITQKNIGQWHQRILEINENDREKALECLRRKKAQEEELKELKQDLNSHQILEDELQQKIHQARRNQQELKRRTNALSARECCAKASQDSQRIENDSDSERIFERWEERIRSQELESLTSYNSHDSFEHSFIKEEERKSLEIELDQITSKK